MCKFKNRLDADRCVYCGTQFSIYERNPDKTTEILGDMPSSSSDDFVAPTDFQHELTQGSIALFIMGDSEPILVENVESFILGRSPVDKTNEGFLDLAKYGALRLGVSRHHARIIFNEDGFSIEDLNSSNGTRVDQKRIKPGENYPLSNNSTILLGGLRIAVQLKYPHTDPASQ